MDGSSAVYKRRSKEFFMKKNRRNTKDILYPEMNEKLAEFLGIVLGDGTMTNYFIRISGDKRYDRKYFEYISKITYELFGINSSIYEGKGISRNTFYVQMSSKFLCRYLHDSFKISVGKKRKTIKIPPCIIGNERNERAFLRGLVDTDGTVSRRGKQFTVQFISDYPSFRKAVYRIGKRIGVFTYLNGDETGTNSWFRIVKYFTIIGSSNPKHIIRFKEKYFYGQLIYLRDVAKLQGKSEYKNLTLPYKITDMGS